MNLFAYGTLMNKTYLKAVCGKSFESKEGVIYHYKRYATESGYPYIVPEENSQVEGILYFGIDSESMGKIDKYEAEGTIYNREKLKVQVKDGQEIESFVYVGNVYNMRRVFGEHINVNIVSRVEEFIENKIGERLGVLYRFASDNPSDQELEILSKKEFLGAEIKEVLAMFFNNEYVSNYAIDNELKFRGLPEFPNQENIPVKIYYNYLSFIFHEMILSQMEEHIYKNFSYITYSSYPLYEKTLSVLTALKFLNSRLLDLLFYMEDFFKNKNFKKITYLEMAKRCVMIARDLFLAHKEEIRLIAMEVKRNQNPGLLSLGIELEFSNLGYKTSKKNVSFQQDKAYSGFKYFNDFDLLRRLWKIGGHVDDHKLSEQEEKRGGFLEFAIGRESVYTGESSPLTKSLYTCNALISELIIFTNIKPHSLHINIQNNKGIDWKKENNTDFIKCLILLGGDFRKIPSGKIVERRIYNQELVKDPNGYIRFICENRHSYHKTKAHSIIEYQFPRLTMMKNYELIIGAYKGFQTAYNPRPFGSKVSLLENLRIKHESSELKKWACNVKPVSNDIIEDFLELTEEGLMTENQGKPAHSKRYIDDLMFGIEKELKSINESISDPSRFMRLNQDIPYQKLVRKFLIS